MKIITILITFFMSGLVSQGGDTTLIKKFLIATTENKVSSEEIIKQYLYLTPEKDNSKNGKKIAQIQFQLSALRDSLKGKSPEKFTYVRYADLSPDEQSINIGNSLKNDVYVVKYDNTYFLSILLKKGKINSFATMDKGGRKVFLVN